jgi:hypothetical protein
MRALDGVSTRSLEGLGLNPCCCLFGIDEAKANIKPIYECVGVMEDYKLRDLRASHTLGWSWNFVVVRYTGFMNGTVQGIYFFLSSSPSCLSSVHFLPVEKIVT